jgi:hypothetical protein
MQVDKMSVDISQKMKCRYVPKYICRRIDVCSTAICVIFNLCPFQGAAPVPVSWVRLFRPSEQLPDEPARGRDRDEPDS